MKRVMMMVLMAAGAVMAASGKTLINRSIELEGADAVYTQEVSQAQCLVREAWAELELVKVYVPAAETGKVTVATWQMGAWTNLVEAACTNNTEAAVVMDFAGGDAVFYGPMRVLYDQTGAGTNAWGSVLIIR